MTAFEFATIFESSLEILAAIIGFTTGIILFRQ
jgi:hypothetical protein